MVNRLITSFLVASYSIGTASASISLNESVKLVPINKGAIVSLKQTNDELMSFEGQLNKQIKSLTKSKFKFEAGVVGKHSYLVSLKDRPASHFYNLNKNRSNTNRSKINNQSQLAYSDNNLATNYTDQQSYQQALLRNQNSLISTLQNNGVSIYPRYQFTQAVNGFTLRVDQDIALAISENDAVASVLKLGASQLQSYSAPEDIGANKVWQGNENYHSTGFKGEGIVIGVLDTGINSNHPSFSQHNDSDFKYNSPEKYVGECASTGDSRCNDKLIGIRTYQAVQDKVFGEVNEDGIAISPPLETHNNAMAEGFEYQLGEDYHGHGSHVASIIAGNNLTDIPLHYPRYKAWSSAGTPIYKTAYDVSGIAPNAQLISYQVCDPIGEEGSCEDEAVLKAIDDAITDGVDVINFSIAKTNGGQENPWLDPVELAFLNAHQAGIVVVTAVGNGNQYLKGKGDHPSPWLLSVGVVDKSDSFIVATDINEISGGDAETIPKKSTFDGLTAITDYRAYTGYSGEAFVGNPVVAESKIDVSILSTEDLAKLKSCIDLSRVNFLANEIAICLTSEFGNTDFFSDKSHYQVLQHMADEVKASGAGGMIAVATSNMTQYITVNFADDFPATLAKTQVNNSSNSNKFYDWVLTSNQQDKTVDATINPITEYRAPSLLGYMYQQNTSAGPGYGVNGEYLLPSVVAPGVNILAASADERPYNKGGDASNWLPQSGSSTATAVVSGAAALVKQAHPDWSVSEIISALAMTSKPAIHSETSKLGLPNAFTMGAGLINVERAINSALIMHESVENYLNTDPVLKNVSTLNLPAAIESECYSSCSLLRVVTATKDSSWHVETHMDYASAEVSVSPAEFTLKKGESQEITIEFKVVEESFRFGWDFDNWENQYNEDSSDILNNEKSMTGGDIIFVPGNRELPEAHWPVSVQTKLDIVNDYHVIDTDMNKGSKKLTSFSVNDVNTAEFNVYQPSIVTANKTTLVPISSWDDMSCYLHRENSCSNSLFDVEKQISDKQAYVEWINVAPGSKRLVAEAGTTGQINLLDNRRRYGVKVAIGRDFNKNAYVDFKQELICISDFTVAYSTNDGTEASNNFCSITDPTAGDYWVIYQWGISSDPSYTEFWKEQLTTQISTYTSVVSDDPATNIQLSVDGDDVIAHWDLNLQSGQRAYTAFNAVDNVKTINLDIKRSKDPATIRLLTDPKDVKPDAILDFVIEINENTSNLIRNLDLTLSLPTSLSMIEDSVAIVNHDYADLTAQVSSQSLTITGQLESAAELSREYQITTNDTDEMCRTPDVGGQTHGGYVNLGLTPVTGSAMRLDENSSEFYLLSPLAENIVSNPRRADESGELESKQQWAARVHKDQYGPFNWMVTVDETGQKLIDREHIVVDLEEVFSETENATPWVSLFGNGEYSRGRYMYLFDNGFIDFHNFASTNPNGTQVPNTHKSINFSMNGGFNGSNLADVIAPLWRSNFHDAQFLVPFRPQESADFPASGISIANLGTKLIVNYDNVQTGWKQVCKDEQLIDLGEIIDGSRYRTQCETNTGEIVRTNKNSGEYIHSSQQEFYGADNYDFQVFIETGEAKNQPGNYEVIIAYDDIRRTLFNDPAMVYSDNIAFDDARFEANVGILGHQGYRNSYGGLYRGAEYFSDESAENKFEIYQAIKNGKVVCFDYTGPESKSSSVRFKAKVEEQTLAGDVLSLVLANNTTDLEFENTLDVQIATTLTVTGLRNIEMIEDGQSYTLALDIPTSDLIVDVSTDDSGLVANAEIVNQQLIITLSSLADFSTKQAVNVAVTVTDKQNSANTFKGSFSVDVLAVNDAPVIFFEQDTFSIMSDEFLELIAFANDKDADPLTYLWQGSKVQEGQRFNSSISLSNLPAGDHQFVLTVSDGMVDVSKTFTVDVTQAEEQDLSLREDPDGGAIFWLTFLTLFSLIRRRTQYQN